MRRKYQSLSTTCRIEYIDSESYSLDTFSDKQIEKNVKLYMLDVLKYNATYYYRLALQYSDKKSFYIEHMNKEFCRTEWNIIEIISTFKLPYPKLDKKSFVRLMKIVDKCINDYLNFTKKLDAQTLFDNKGQF